MHHEEQWLNPIITSSCSSSRLCPCRLRVHTNAHIIAGGCAADAYLDSCRANESIANCRTNHRAALIQRLSNQQMPLSNCRLPVCAAGSLALPRR